MVPAPLPPPPLASPSALLGTVVVILVTGDTVTWAGAAPAGRQFRSPGTKCRRATGWPPGALDKDDTEGAWDEAAVGGVLADMDVCEGRDGTGSAGGAMVGESSGEGDTSPEGAVMDSCEPPTPRFPVSCGAVWDDCVWAA